MELFSDFDFYTLTFPGGCISIHKLSQDTIINNIYYGKTKLQHLFRYIPAEDGNSLAGT